MKRILLLIAALSSLLPLAFPFAALADCGVREPVTTLGAGTGGSVCVFEREQCQGTSIDYACCMCEKLVYDPADKEANKIDPPIKVVGEKGYTYDTCKTACDSYGSLTDRYKLYTQVGAGRLPQGGRPTPTTLEEKQAVSKYCFTKADCISPKYGGSAEAFRPGGDCPAGQGKCIAPEPQLDLSYPIGNIKTVSGYRGFVGTVFNYATTAAATAAAIMFVWGGMRYIFGSAFQNIKRAKEIMVDAAIGLVITLAAMAILRTINPDTLKLNKLEVFMVNREEYLGQKLCKDIPTGTEKLSFGDAGRAPNYTPISQLTPADFHIEQAQTQCGFEYYGKNLGDSRCIGSLCKEPDEACIPCRGDDCTQNTVNPGTFICKKATIAGEITQDGDRPALAIWLMAICKDIFVGSYFPDDPRQINVNNYSPNEDTGENYWPGYAMPISQGFIAPTGVKTRQGFSFAVTEADIKKAKGFCSKSGLAGYGLGINFKDSSFVSLKGNYAFLGKDYCEGAQSTVLTNHFLGYAYMRHDQNEAGATMAAMCAAHGFASFHYDREKKSLYGTDEFKAHVWLPNEIEQANSKPNTIKCNLHLSSTNAPGNFSTLGTGTEVTYGGAEFTVEQLANDIGKENVFGPAKSIADTILGFSVCY